MADSQPTLPFGDEQPDSELQSGIYAIRCLANGKVYIGSAVDLAKRWSNHRSLLARAKHRSPHLQAAWNKYGPEAFTFEVVERVPIDDLIATEQRYIDLFDVTDPNIGFNTCPTAGSTLGITFSHTPESRARISEATRGIPKSDEARENITRAIRKRWESPEYRAKFAAIAAAREWTEEARAEVGERLGAANRGRKHTTEARANMGAAHVGLIQSEETKAKRSATLTGRVITPGWKAKISASKAGRVLSEEHKARIGAGGKARKSLTLEEIAEIKAELARGSNQRVLAERFGCSKATISNIKTGKYVGYSQGS